MNVGIVILNYNDYVTTIELLERIQNYEVLKKIVVIDNNSTDNSYIELIKYKSEKIKVIKSEKNRGYGAGNNIGCKYLTENNLDYIIISNPDVIFEEKDIINLIEGFANNQVAIVSPVVNEHGILNRGWQFQNAFIAGLTNINYIGRRFKKKSLYKEEHYNSNYSKVDIVSGCFFIIKTEVLKKVGYFDENVFLYYEENILAKKIQKEGKSIVIDNYVQIIHNHSVSINKSINKINKFKILAKSQRYYYKNYENSGIMEMIWLYFSYILTIVISKVIKILSRE